MEPRDMMDILILILISIGLIWAAIRLYTDFTRPLPDETNEQNNN